MEIILIPINKGSGFLHIVVNPRLHDRVNP